MSNASASSDDAHADGSGRNEEMILEHENEHKWHCNIFACIQGGHPAMSQAFMSQVMTYAHYPHESHAPADQSTSRP